MSFWICVVCVHAVWLGGRILIREMKDEGVKEEEEEGWVGRESCVCEKCALAVREMRCQNGSRRRNGKPNGRVPQGSLREEGLRSRNQYGIELHLGSGSGN